MGDVVDLRRPSSVRRRRPLRPFTVEHFKLYCSRLVFDDGERRDPEPWQLDYARDVFRGYETMGGRVGPYKGGAHDKTCLLVVPEANGKTTFVGELGLYGCDWAERPWIPVGAHSRDQAKVLYAQVKMFIQCTPGMDLRFKCFDGYRAIRPLWSPQMAELGLCPTRMVGKRRPGEGIEICPWDPDSNDGAIPYPYYICDELHRHEDMSLWRLWEGKCKKRGAQGIGISTAGVPGTEFEELRDRVRQRAVTRVKRYGGTHYRGGRMTMYEFMVEDPELIVDPVTDGEVDEEKVKIIAKVVAKVNPLSSNTPDIFEDDLMSPSLDLGEFKRLKANIPARSSRAAITDGEWAGAAAAEYDSIPDEERRDVGIDLGWKHDTTVIVELWRGPSSERWPKGFLLLDEARVIIPPRDGSSLHPDRIKEKLYAVRERGPIDAVVMDTSDGEDIAAWVEDELDVTLVDRQQGNDFHVLDYKNFMRGLRNCQPSKYPLSKAKDDEAKHSWPLRHVRRCPLLTRHSMNAIARRLPRGDYRFDRPEQSRTDKGKQDIRVIDALSASGFVVTHAVGGEPDAMPLFASFNR